MAQAPPPPQEGQPLPPPPAGRPPKATAAGIIEIALGILVLLFTLLLLVQASDEDLLAEPLVVFVLLLSLAQGGLDITAGALILKLSPAGRILGIVMAAIGAAFALLALAQGATTTGTMLLIVSGAALRVTVIAFLVQTAPAFVRRTP